MKFAIQTLFSFGWDYCETHHTGGRYLYDTREQADKELAKDLNDLSNDSTEEDSINWRVVEYHGELDVN